MLFSGLLSVKHLLNGKLNMKSHHDKVNLLERKNESEEMAGLRYLGELNLSFRTTFFSKVG